MSGIGVREHDYIGFSEICSSKEGSGSSSSSSREMEVKEGVLNLKETELRLGLPGSVSPDRKTSSTELNLLGISNKVEEKGQIFMGSLKNFTSGAKRGFLDTVEGSMGEVKGIVGNNWHGKGGGGGGEHGSSGFLSPIGSLGKPAMAIMDGNQKGATANKEQNRNQSVRAAEDSAVTPAAKSQVVSWPPIRSYRRNTMAAAANPMKNTMEAENKCSASSLYVKVSMDGAPYLRKIDLANYKTYQELSTGLEKMFSCFTLGQCGSDGASGRDGLSESRLMDLLQGSEYVLTYEDKDGDWMLVGDVPWEMFTSTCRRLRIMKGSEAIGLAPRAAEKCKNKN